MENLSKSLLVFGEVLFDIINGEAHLGGAPLNVAAHFVQHSNRASLISATGTDDLGENVKNKATEYGVNLDLLQTNDSPTGIVEVSVDEKGQPSYEIVENVAWDSIVLSDNDYSYIKQQAWDCFYFGSLAQRSRTNQETLKKIFDGNSFPNIFFDVNLRKDYFNKTLIEESFQYCNILKLNDEEIDVLSPLIFNKQLSIRDFAEKVSDQFNIETILITLGAKGAAYYSKGSYGVVPGIKVKVADTVGAGDSFSAAFLDAFLRGESIENAVAAGCKLGAYVASQKGAVPKIK